MILNSFMPEDVDKLTFKGLHYLGTDLDLTVTSADMTLTCTTAGSVPLIIKYDDGVEIDFQCGNHQYLLSV